MRLIAFTLIVCLIGFTAQAGDEENFHHGQVIKIDGSRLSTWVKLPQSATSGKVIFRDHSGAQQEIDSREIQSITVVLGGETVSFFHTDYIDRKGNQTENKIWVRTVSRGEVTVLKAELDQRVPLFLLQRDNEQLPREVSKHRFSHEIIHYISDHEYLMKDLSEGRYTYTELVSLIDEYNAWKSFE